MIYRQAAGLVTRYEPQSEWGAFTRSIEIGDDRYAVRHIDAFANGFALRYDRQHWADEVGVLADQYFGDTQLAQGELLSADEFEQRWRAAAAAPNQPQVYVDHGRWPLGDPS